MKGTILDYSVKNDIGYISGDDGKGYQFSSSDWMDTKLLPKNNLRVDFEIEEKRATNIFDISEKKSQENTRIFQENSFSVVFNLIYKSATIVNTFLLLTIVMFLLKANDKIEPFFSTSNLKEKILIYDFAKSSYLLEDLEGLESELEEKIRKELLKFLNLSDEEITERVKEYDNKSKEIEGKNAVGTFNRSQQAYHFEQQIFSDNIDLLGIRLDTEYYDTEIIEANENKAVVRAIPKKEQLRSYAGVIEYYSGSYTKLICQTKSPSQTIEIPYNVERCRYDSEKIL